MCIHYFYEKHITTPFPRVIQKVPQHLDVCKPGWNNFSFSFLKAFFFTRIMEQGKARQHQMEHSKVPRDHQLLGWLFPNEKTELKVTDLPKFPSFSGEAWFGGSPKQSGTNTMSTSIKFNHSPLIPWSWGYKCLCILANKGLSSYTDFIN